MRGIVICPQPIAAEAAVEVLRAGGNAVDALVSAAFVQGVADPLMCGLGGYGVMLVHQAGSGTDQVLDFFSRAPGGIEEGNAGKLLREFEYDYGFILDGEDNETGYASIAVPGEVAGLSLALARYGTLDWTQALSPAIAVADAGVPVTPTMYEYMATPATSDKPSTLDRLLATDECRAVLTDNGKLYQVGDRLNRDDYASTLRRLAEAGPRDFYEGGIAARMVADFAANGSLINAEDLRTYAVTVTEAARVSYRDVLLSVPRFPSGGPSVVESLNLLELQLPEPERDWTSSRAVSAMARALKLGIEDKYRFLAGTREGDFSDDVLLDKGHAAELLAGFDGPAAGGSGDADTRDTEAADTTHIAVVDQWGNAAALTHTLASGSGVVTPGLGFVHNNFMHGFDPRPGKWNSLRPYGVRPASMCPTFLSRDGQLLGIVGATGSTRIVSSIVQVVSHVVDRGWEPAAAVLAPRINCQRSGLIQLEGRFPGYLLSDLAGLGWRTERTLANFDSYFGKVYLLMRDGAGTQWLGAGDPRGDGGGPMSVPA